MKSEILEKLPEIPKRLIYFFYYFFFFAVYIEGYLLSQKFKRMRKANVQIECPDRMCICAGWSAGMFSRYIQVDRISLDQVCIGVG